MTYFLKKQAGHRNSQMFVAVEIKSCSSCQTAQTFLDFQTRKWCLVAPDLPSVWPSFQAHCRIPECISMWFSASGGTIQSSKIVAPSTRKLLGFLGTCFWSHMNSGASSCQEKESNRFLFKKSRKMHPNSSAHSVWWEGIPLRQSLLPWYLFTCAHQT